jgi:hypothetical protein
MLPLFRRLNQGVHSMVSRPGNLITGPSQVGSDTHLAPGLAWDFDPTLTTTALYRSSSGWFETCS